MLESDFDDGPQVNFTAQHNTTLNAQLFVSLCSLVALLQSYLILCVLLRTGSFQARPLQQRFQGLIWWRQARCTVRRVQLSRNVLTRLRFRQRNWQRPWTGFERRCSKRVSHGNVAIYSPTATTQSH